MIEIFYDYYICIETKDRLRKDLENLLGDAQVSGSVSVRDQHGQVVTSLCLTI